MDHQIPAGMEIRWPLPAKNSYSLPSSALTLFCGLVSAFNIAFVRADLHNSI